MRRNKEYIIAGSLLGLAVLGMVFAYNMELGDQKEQEQEEQKIAFQEVNEEEEEAKEEVEDVSKILAAKERAQKKEKEEKEKTPEPELEQEIFLEPETEETAAITTPLQFKQELLWPAEGNVIMNYSMDKTIYFASLDQYRYNPAVVISAKVNDPVIAAAEGSILDITNSEVTGCTVRMDLGDGYQAIYGQLKEVNKSVGDRVGAGEVIGFISEPTKYYSVEGSNLYFELLKDDKPVDPMEYFQESSLE